MDRQWDTSPASKLCVWASTGGSFCSIHVISGAKIPVVRIVYTWCWWHLLASCWVHLTVVQNDWIYNCIISSCAVLSFFSIYHLSLFIFSKFGMFGCWRKRGLQFTRCSIFSCMCGNTWYYWIGLCGLIYSFVLKCFFRLDLTSALNQKHVLSINLSTDLLFNNNVSMFLLWNKQRLIVFSSAVVHLMVLNFCCCNITSLFP